MKRKIFINMSLLAILVVLVASIFYSIYYYDFFKIHMETVVEEKAEIISRGLEEAKDKVAYLEALNLKGSSSRITLIDSSGKVVFDSHISEALLENHLFRPEVHEAITSGCGEVVRKSDTQLEKIYYYALRQPDSSILRLAVTIRSFSSIFLNTLPYIILFMVVIIVLCLFIAFALTKKITKPINDINFHEKELLPAYEELTPFYSKIEEQSAKIEEQLKELKEQGSKIKLILSNTLEGIAIIDSKGRVLSVNKSLLDIVGAPPGSYEGRSFLEISRKNTFNESLRLALQGENCRGETTMGEKTYSFTFNPVYHEGNIEGAVLLLLDITEKHKAEMIRREFSANVSHELKTPLTAISGYAELISTGMATYEDAKRFSGEIQKEASRLLTIITDIIKLSRLEEGLPQEEKQEVNLFKAVKASAERLADSIENRAINLKLPDNEVSILGNEGMLEELIMNLLENAVKYNKYGGSISIDLREEEASVILEVKDTGVGIDKKHQERIFERFYRVDKSHSKKTGGTGLGLAIVKHIAEYHQGTITVESSEGSGTTMRVVFNKGL